MSTQVNAEHVHHAQADLSEIRFLVLGMGPAQADLIRTLRSLGVGVIHALGNRASPGVQELVDASAMVDIRDVAAVRRYVVEHRLQHLYSVGSDVAMPTVAQVAADLALPTFITPAVAATCGSKLRQRMSLQDQPGAVAFREMRQVPDLDGLELPVVVKPCDSQGQRGVTTVRHLKDLAAACHNARGHSPTGQVIAEAWIPGPEISANAYFIAGELVLCLASDRLVWEAQDGGIVRGHVLSGEHSRDLKERVQTLVRTTAQAVGIQDGPAYFQIKVADGHPRLIECAARWDGCHLWRLIAMATGFDPLAATVRHLLGERAAWPRLEISGSWHLEFACQPPGTRMPPVDHHPEGVFREDYFQPGETVPVVNGRLEKCGYHIFQAAPV